MSWLFCPSWWSGTHVAGIVELSAQLETTIERLREQRKHCCVQMKLRNQECSTYKKDAMDFFSQGNSLLAHLKVHEHQAAHRLLSMYVDEHKQLLDFETKCQELLGALGMSECLADIAANLNRIPGFESLEKVAETLALAAKRLEDVSQLYDEHKSENDATTSILGDTRLDDDEVDALLQNWVRPQVSTEEPTDAQPRAMVDVTVQEGAHDLGAMPAHASPLQSPSLPNTDNGPVVISHTLGLDQRDSDQRDVDPIPIQDQHPEEYHSVVDDDTLVLTTLHALKEAESVQYASSDTDEEDSAAGALLAEALTSNERTLQYA